MAQAGEGQRGGPAGRIAIVGAGPAGCYLAQALLRAAPGLEVNLIDALPVPFGLLRYGVAPDHQGTKAVTRQFERLFDRQGARFFGNVTVGRDITLDTLRASHDAVVLAAGLAGDRRLGIPGDDLPGVIGAGRLTRAILEHPDADPLPDLGPAPLIIGNGNVAIDILRLLSKTPEEFAGSDLGSAPGRWLAEGGIGAITVIGRAPAGRARFDPAMIRELGRLSAVRISVGYRGGDADGPEAAARLAALAAIDGHGAGPRRIRFRFALRPVAVEGGARVEALRVVRPDGAEERIACSAIITAIGFADAGLLGRDGLIGAAADAESGLIAPGLFAAGWFRRGPRGTIPDARAEAQALAGRILAALAPDPGRAGAAALAGLADIVDWQGWRRIDARERAAAPPDRVRAKIPTRGEMLRIARERENAS